MNTSTKRAMILLCYRAGLTEESTSRLLVKSHWNETELKLRLNSLKRQRAMPELVKTLHAAEQKDTHISRFCRLSQRTDWLMLMREI